MPSITWLAWHRDAFARAHAERKPVLLSIVTSWSHACQVMEHTTYADPAVVALIAERFVPVRVDADRRPDISERYSLGGWPTTALLTNDGRIAGGGTFADPAGLRALLERAAAAFATQAADLDLPHTGEEPGRAAPPSTSSDEALIAQTFAAFDERHGGFGIAPKHPLTAPVRLALELVAAEHPQAREITATTLDAMGWGPLYDAADGGFFHYAEQRDWSAPHTEKLLEIQAALLDTYAVAADILGVQRYAERARDTIRYVQNWLSDSVDGGWAASQRADPRFYGASAPAEAGERPPTDRTLYTRANARMISAALRAARLLDDESLGHAAIAGLERVLLACYKPGAGVAHFHDGTAQVRGLMADQIAMAGASLDAYDATGNIVYEMMAEELARHALRTAWDEERGGFFDRAVADAAEAIGAMNLRLRPFAENCEAAVVLARLAASSGEHDFTGFSQAILEAVAGDAGAQGPEAAHLVLARRAVGLR